MLQVLHNASFTSLFLNVGIIRAGQRLGLILTHVRRGGCLPPRALACGVGGDRQSVQLNENY